MSNDILINYNKTIALKSKFNYKYLKSLKEGKIRSISTHPILRHTDKEIDISKYIEKHLRTLDLHPEEYMLVKQDDPEYTGPVCFNDQVLLKSWRNYTVSYNSKSEVAVSEEVHEGRLCKFTVVNPESLLSDMSTARFLKVNSEIMLKSVFDDYLIVNEKYELFTNGPNYCDQTLFYVQLAKLPPKPVEFDKRIFLDHNYLTLWTQPEMQRTHDRVKQYRSTNLKDLKDYSDTELEYVLMNDLLKALVGLDANYIVRSHEVLYQDQFPHFNWHLNMDKKEVLQSGLSCIQTAASLCASMGQYDSVVYYVRIHSEYTYGMVSHCLSYHLRQLLREYELTVCQLNSMFHSAQLTMTKLNYYLQPALETLNVMFNVCQRVFKKKGGTVINIIYNLLRSNSTEANQKVCNYLYEHISKEYLEMLYRWLFMGVIEDPYDDFMVYENRLYTKESLLTDSLSKYYYFRFQPNVNNSLLVFQDVERLIVNTGKCINIMKECYRDKFDYELEYPYKCELTFANSRKLIEEAHSWASSKLLDYLVKEKNLFECLASVKSFFLIGNSDYLNTFIEQTHSEFDNNARTLDIKRLNNLLQMCISYSTLHMDKWSEDYLITVGESNVLSELYGIQKGEAPLPTDPLEMFLGEQINLDLTLQFPLTIVLNCDLKKKYQVLFKLLLMVKMCEFRITQSWSGLMSLKDVHNPNLRATHFLVHKMKTFTGNLLYYLNADAIQPQWSAFYATATAATNLDQVLEAHKIMMQNLLRDTLCDSPDLLKNLVRAMYAIHEFSIMLNKNIDLMTLETIDLNYDAYTGFSKEEVRRLKLKEHSENLFGSDYMENLKSYDKHYMDRIKKFFKKIFESKDKEKMMNGFYSRVDFNGYYSEALFDNRLADI